MNAVKQIYNVGKTTSGCALLQDLHLPPIELVIEERQINYLQKVRKDKDSLRGKAYWQIPDWENRLTELCSKWLNIILTKEDLDDMEKVTSKKNKENRSKTIFDKKTSLSTSERKLRSMDSICCDKRHNEYSKISTILNTKRIFEIRTSSNNLKSNNKMVDQDNDEETLCRWCLSEKETNDHVFGKCPVLMHERNWLTSDHYYKCTSHKDIETLADQAKFVECCANSFKNENISQNPRKKAKQLNKKLTKP